MVPDWESTVVNVYAIEVMLLAYIISNACELILLNYPRYLARENYYYNHAKNQLMIKTRGILIKL